MRVRPPHVPEWAGEDSHNAELIERRARAVLDAAPVAPDVERHLIVEESVDRGLQQFAEGIGASAIVVGCPDRTRRGRIETGTVAERLLRGSPCVVALAPHGCFDIDIDGEGCRRIVVGCTANDEVRAALRTAATLARSCGATVRVVSVTGTTPASSPDLPGREGAGRELAHAELDRALRALASSVLVERHALEGDPTERVLEQANGWADLIVAGSRGHGSERRVLLGSVSAGLLARAEVPVIIAPGGADGELGERSPMAAGAGA